MTAFPGFCILAVVRGVPWGDGRRANPTRATARPCVGGASRRFRLRQSGPAGDVRQSQPRGQRPRRTAGDGRPYTGGGPALCRKGLSVASGSGSRARLRPSRGAGALRSPLHAQAMALPARLSYYVCHTFPFSNVILCGSGKGSVLRHARGTSAKRQPVWRRRCRSSTGGGRKPGRYARDSRQRAGDHHRGPFVAAVSAHIVPAFFFAPPSDIAALKTTPFASNRRPWQRVTVPEVRLTRGKCATHARTSRRKTGVIQRRDETRRPNAPASHGRCTEAPDPRTGAGLACPAKRIGIARPPHGNARPAHGQAARACPAECIGVMQSAARKRKARARACCHKAG